MKVHVLHSTFIALKFPTGSNEKKTLRYLNINYLLGTAESYDPTA